MTEEREERRKLMGLSTPAVPSASTSSLACTWAAELSASIHTQQYRHCTEERFNSLLSLTPSADWHAH